MPLSAPKQNFGIHSFTPYDIATGIPFGPEMRILSSSSVVLTGELVDLRGGSNLYTWAVERGNITGEITLGFREYPDYLFEILLGNQATTGAAEASGAIVSTTTSGASVAPDNLNGTSVVSVGGIATVDVSTAADLKFGKYIVEAVSATTVDVYCTTNVDFATGTGTQFVDDTMKINSAPLTITAAGTTAVTNYGFELTGDAGPIAMTVGDTAFFCVRPINQGNTDVTVGVNNQAFKNFGAYIAAQRQGSGRMVLIDAFNLTASGMPLNFNEKEWSEGEVTVRMSVDCNGDLFRYKSLDSADCQ